MTVSKGSSLYSTIAIPIIFLAAAGQPKPPERLDAQMLWVGIAISLLISSASLGLTVVRTRPSNRSSKKFGSMPNKSAKRIIATTVSGELEDNVSVIATLENKLKRISNDIYTLQSKYDWLKQQLASPVPQPQAPSASHSPSLKLITEAPKAAPDFLLDGSHPQSVETFSQKPLPSQQAFTLNSDQNVISSERNMTSKSNLYDFAAAIENSNGSVIRQHKKSELNITKESEDALVRREPGHKTQLEEVNGGGSYLLLSDANRNWLFPTPLTLRTIARHQPSKGLYHYEVQPDSMPRMKQPAEIRIVSGNRWEVIEMGTIIVAE